MASIQQSMNQLLGALAGATTAGSYMFRQSGTYQDMVAEQKAKKLDKTAGEVHKQLVNEIDQNVNEPKTEEELLKSKARTKTIVKLADYRDELRQ